MSSPAVIRFPNPVLKQPTRDIAAFDSNSKSLIQTLIKVMRSHPRCVGLAAPQLGFGSRVAVMDASVHPKAGKTHGMLVLVNPVIQLTEGGKVGREGCLSIPDFTANVKRAERVLLRAADEQGNPYELWMEGFEAIVAQHEVDHLEGMLFLDRVVNLKTDVFRRKIYL